jgi:hypothetical protein
MIEKSITTTAELTEAEALQGKSENRHLPAYRCGRKQLQRRLKDILTLSLTSR